jgi:type I restriction enzyme S subunit
VISRSSLTDVYPKKQLGDVVEFLDSMRSPVTESDRRAGEYPYYGANGLQGTIDDFIFDEPLILLAEDGGHFGAPDRGIAYCVSGKTWVNNHAHVLRPKECVDLGFLCRVLENYDVTPWVTGTTRGKLTQAGAAQIVLPLPPLPEQRRIAAILDKANALRAKRRAALPQLDTLTQSIFLDMFGMPKENVKGWPLGSLMEICSPKQWPTISTPELTEVGFPVFGANGLIGNYTAYNHEAPTVLITCRGATCGTINVSPPRCYVTGNAMALDDPDLERITIEYLAAVLIMRGLADTISGTAQPQITRQGLEHVKLPLPPLSLQSVFARQIIEVERMKRQQNESLSGLDALFTSLQHRAFRGEL